MNLSLRLLKLKDLVKYYIYLNNILELNYIRADTGEKAVEIFQSRNRTKSLENLHIILMDATLPEISGYEASLIIKTLIKDDNLEDCIIIGNSADSSKEHIKKCEDAMMNLVFNKP